MIRQFLSRVRPDALPLAPRIYLPSLERDEYIMGWRWGVICGIVLTSTLFLIARAL